MFAGRTPSDWKELPEDGFLVLAEYRPTGLTIYDGADWIWWDGEHFCFVASQEWGVDQPAPEGVCSACLKRGIGVSDAEYLQAYQQARNSQWP